MHRSPWISVAVFFVILLLTGPTIFGSTLPSRSVPDYGDAPDPTYPTLIASDGPYHWMAGGLTLGALVDWEPDGQPNATATGLSDSS